MLFLKLSLRSNLIFQCSTVLTHKTVFLVLVLGIQTLIICLHFADEVSIVLALGFLHLLKILSLEISNYLNLMS